jgi:hypothetical protein
MNHAAADGLPGGVPPQFIAGGRVVGEESTVEVAGPPAVAVMAATAIAKESVPSIVREPRLHVAVVLFDLPKVQKIFRLADESFLYRACGGRKTAHQREAP